MSLTPEEVRGLRTQLTRCVPPPPSGMNGRLQIEIDLILNFDGSVSPDSKIVSSPTPELGQRMMKALAECQPYLLPAEYLEMYSPQLVTLPVQLFRDHRRRHNL